MKAIHCFSLGSQPITDSNIVATEGNKLYLKSIGHGEYDEDWIVEIDKTGNEIQRWNTKYVDYIKWDTQEGVKE